jgi:hypothetical protein
MIYYFDINTAKSILQRRPSRRCKADVSYTELFEINYQSCSAQQKFSAEIAKDAQEISTVCAMAIVASESVHSVTKEWKTQEQISPEP